jgi:hypothetical protein
MYIYKPIIHLTKRIKKRNKNKNWFVIVVTNVVFYFFNFHQHQIFVCRVFFVMFFFCTFSLFRPHAQHVIYKTETTKQKREKFHHHVIRRSKIHKKIKIKNSAPSFSFDLLFHPFLKIGRKFLSLGKNSNFAGLYFSIKKNKTENTDDQQFQDH